MMGKAIRMAVVLAAAGGIPFLWFNPALRSSLQERFGGWFGDKVLSGSTVDLAYEYPVHSGDEPPAEVSARPLLAGATSGELSELLRFDISPRWITERWARVSTVRAEPDLEGLRVPVVTGTELTDLAGSLTYYFDRDRKVRRITFFGHTGDESELAAFVTKQFNLHLEPALGPGLYVARWNAKPTSLLRIQHAPVVRSDQPHARLEFTLELNRPDVAFQLSREAQSILNRDRDVGRWQGIWPHT